MGGHGGLNILPQKRWNVYNYENREKVRRDEEAAAKEEQIKREQSRKRDAEFRLERLRASRGLAPLSKPEESDPEEEPKSSNHINLFEGIKLFDPIAKEERRSERKEERRSERKEERSERKKAKEAEVRVVTAEEEKYRLGYGVAGKGVKVPWYLERKGSGYREEEEERGEREDEGSGGEKKKRKKSLEELREERMKREKREKEREREVVFRRLEASVRSSGGFFGRM